MKKIVAEIPYMSAFITSVVNCYLCFFVFSVFSARHQMAPTSVVQQPRCSSAPGSVGCSSSGNILAEAALVANITDVNLPTTTQ